MASLKERRASNAEGDFYVDESCIDCGACRWIAPESFNRDGPKSRVYRQPQSADQTRDALRALIACPTASIGAQEEHDMGAAAKAFPYVYHDQIYSNGYTSESSFGASSWLIRRESGNVLVDSPRFAGPLVKGMEELGGVATMWLSHRDDIADHDKFAKRFGCQRIIHEAEQISGPERQLSGQDAIALDDELTVIPTPGHTQGSCCLLYADRALFTGDHLAWNIPRGHLVGFRRACWYSWDALIASMEKLREYTFSAVYPGHGAPKVFADVQQAQSELERCIAWCKEMA